MIVMYDIYYQKCEAVKASGAFHGDFEEWKIQMETEGKLEQTPHIVQFINSEKSGIR